MNASKDQLKTSHRLYDCLYWNSFLAVPLITACVAIAKSSLVWMIVYIVMSLVIFVVVLFKFFCTHCPHYIHSDNTVNCMFIRWAPKYFQPKQGPYEPQEKAIVALALLVWVVFPFFWLHLHIGLLAIYVISLTVLVATMKRYECGRCIHFECPANSVPEDARTRFLEENLHQTDGLS